MEKVTANKYRFPYQKGKIYKATQEGKTFFIKVLGFGYPSHRIGNKKYIQMRVKNIESGRVEDINLAGYPVLNKYGAFIPMMQMVIDNKPVDEDETGFKVDRKPTNG